MPRNQKKNHWPLILAVFLIAFLIFYLFFNKKEEIVQIDYFAQVDFVNDHIKGSPKAKLFIIEYSDMECPYCKNYRVIANQITQIYGGNGDVALVYRHYFDGAKKSSSRMQAIYAECVANIDKKKFFPFVEKIYETTNSDGNFSETKIFEIASLFEIDSEPLRNCFLNNQIVRDKVNQHLSLGVKNGITKTPFIVFYSPNVISKKINYHELTSKQFQDEIDKALANIKAQSY